MLDSDNSLVCLIQIRPNHILNQISEHEKILVCTRESFWTWSSFRCLFLSSQETKSNFRNPSFV